MVTAGMRVIARTIQEAMAQEVILIAAVWLPAVADVMQAAGSLEGKIVITCVSRLQPDFTGQTISLATDLKISVAEAIQ